METKPNEIWKDVEHWPKYKVSNMGRVMFSRDGKTRIKKPVCGSGGYYRVTFTDKPNKRVQTFAIHRLVARKFVKGRCESLDVAHLDGNKENNKASNLKWCTRSENESHKKTHGNFVSGNRVPILNIHCLRAIKELHKMKWSQAKIANLFGVSQQTIGNALSPNYERKLIKALNAKES